MSFLEWVGALGLGFYGLVLTAIVGFALLSRLQTRAHDRRLARGWVRDEHGTPQPIEEVRLMPRPVDAVPEGLGVAPRPSPHATEPRHLTPLEYLDEWEWRLWTDVIAKVTR